MAWYSFEIASPRQQNLGDDCGRERTVPSWRKSKSDDHCISQLQPTAAVAIEAWVVLYTVSKYQRWLPPPLEEVPSTSITLPLLTFVT